MLIIAGIGASLSGATMIRAPLPAFDCCHDAVTTIAH